MVLTALLTAGCRYLRDSTVNPPNTSVADVQNYQGQSIPQAPTTNAGSANNANNQAFLVQGCKGGANRRASGAIAD